MLLPPILRSSETWNPLSVTGLIIVWYYVDEFHDRLIRPTSDRFSEHYVIEKLRTNLSKLLPIVDL